MPTWKHKKQAVMLTCAGHVQPGADMHGGVQAELRQPRFEEGLEEVLELANSLSLTHLLKAADLDIKATGKGVPRAEAGLQAAQSFVTDSLSVV